MQTAKVKTERERVSRRGGIGARPFDLPTMPTSTRRVRRPGSLLLLRFFPVRRRGQTGRLSPAIEAPRVLSPLLLLLLWRGRVGY